MRSHATYRLPHLKHFALSNARNRLTVTPIRAYILQYATDPAKMAICIPRPSNKHALRKRHADAYTAIGIAIRNNKLHLTRWDPEDGYTDFDPKKNDELYKSHKRRQRVRETGMSNV